MSDKPMTAEAITLVRIEQPFCNRSHGVAPCQASGAPCFNTYATCTDRANYQEGATRDLYFGLPGQGRPADDLYILPLLASVPNTSPARINVSGADRRANPLGIRATATITFRDAPHSDFLVDPYRAARSYDPLGRGTFWSKWDRRNRFGKVGMTVSIFEGYAGQSLADMVKRVYLCDSIDLSGAETVVMKCRDVLSKASDQKAQCPEVSTGELVADLTEAATSFDVSGAVLSDYPASGTLRIGGEVMTYSSVSQTGGGLLRFTIAQRASDGSEGSDHTAGDLVQSCFRFSNETVDAGLAALYQGFTTIPALYLPVSDWAAEASRFLSSYRLTGLVTSPTPVVDLVGEILEQAQAFQWWDEERHQVRFSAVRPLVDPPRDLNEDAHLIAGSVKVRDFPDRRVSRVYVYYDPRDPTKGREDEENYSRLQSSQDLSLEDAEAYGDKSIRKIFARFVNSGAVALETTARILARYRQGAQEITFAVSDKDGDISVGDVVRIRYHRLQDDTGAPDYRLWIITSRDRNHAARRVHYTAEDATLAGQLLSIAENAVPDYVGDGSDQFGLAWISDDNGFLPNGGAGMTIQ